MTFKRLHITSFVLLICLAAYAAGCGGDDSGSSSQEANTPTATTVDHPAATVSPPTPTATTSTPPVAPSPKPKPSTAPPSTGPTVGVPDLTGQNIAEAQATLKGSGLVATFEAKSGDRSQIQPSWVVCKTVPGAGKKAPGSSPIAVITAAPGGC